MKRQRSHRRFRRGKKEYIWITQQSTGVPQLEGTTTFYDILVAPEDWAQGEGASTANFQRGAVLERIRGWISVAPDQGALSEDTILRQCWTGSIAKTSISALEEWVDLGLTFGPALQGWYNEADILWTHGYAITGGQAPVVTDSKCGQTVQIDVPVKRKLTSQDVIVWATQEGVGNIELDARLSYVLRALVSLP